MIIVVWLGLLSHSLININEFVNLFEIISNKNNSAFRS